MIDDIGCRNTLRILLLQWLLAVSLYERDENVFGFVLSRSDSIPDDHCWIQFFPQSYLFPRPMNGTSCFGDDEINAALDEIASDKLIWSRFIPNAWAPSRFEREIQFTSKGYSRAARVRQESQPGNERLRTVRISFMSWLSKERGECDWTDRGARIFDFLHGDVDGMPVMIYELFAAVKLLEIEGLIGLEYYSEPGRPVIYPKSDMFAELTCAGLICVEEYGGNFWAMRNSQRRGDDNRIFIGSAANVAAHSANVFQGGGNALNMGADLRQIYEMALAVTQNPGKLSLPKDERDSAMQIAREIRVSIEQTTPDRSRVRELGRSLRSILEGAASGVLAEMIRKSSGI